MHQRSAFASLAWTKPAAPTPARSAADTSGVVPFGAWLRAVRTERGWTQGDLAARVGVSHSLLSKVESDERTLSEAALGLLAVAIGEPVELVWLRAGVVPRELLGRLLADPERFLALATAPAS